MVHGEEVLALNADVREALSKNHEVKEASTSIVHEKIVGANLEAALAKTK